MKVKGKGIGIGVVLLALVGLFFWSKKKPAEAAPGVEVPPDNLGEPMTTMPVVRHPEVAPETAYNQLGVEPTSQTELYVAQATKQPLVSPVIGIEETTENREAIETIEDAEEAKLMALPFGGQCSKTFLDGSGNYYSCVNGYAVLTIRASQTPETMEEMKTMIEETGHLEPRTTGSRSQIEPETWMEKEVLEEARTGDTQVERNKAVYEYRLAHPGVSGSEAYQIIYGSYLGR